MNQAGDHGHVRQAGTTVAEAVRGWFAPANEVLTGGATGSSPRSSQRLTRCRTGPMLCLDGEGNGGGRSEKKGPWEFEDQVQAKMWKR